MSVKAHRTVIAALAVLTMATVVGCVGYDPRTDDSDVFGTPAPTGQPTSTTSATSGGSGSMHVVLAHAVGDDVTIEVADGSGTLLEATSGAPGDGASVEPGRLDIANDDPSTLRLTWTGGPCASADVLLIDPTRREFILGQRACGGDSIVNDRVLILRFSQPIDASEVHGRVEQGLIVGG
jgi:hypothetical protein